MKKNLIILLLIFVYSGLVSGQVISNGELVSWSNATGSIQIPTTVTSIHDSVFINNKNISSVYIPTSVTKVGKEVFGSCSSLVSVTIGHADSLITNGISIAPTAFAGCVAITSITLNNDVLTKDAGNSPFRNMASLLEVIIGDRTKALPENIFLNCLKLKTVHVGQFNTQKTTVSIPSTAFSGCTNLETVDVYKNFLVLGSPSPFINASNFDFGNDVTFIYTNAFSNCSKITSVELPTSIVQLFPGAFQYCNNLKSISFSGAKTIGQNAFYNCSSLESVTIPDAVKLIEGATFYGCSKLSSVNIGSSVSEIRSTAFYGCSALQTVLLPNSLKIIGDKTFMECTSLQSIQLSNTLMNIGAYAFSGCTKLKTIPLPHTIKQIGTYAFDKCINLKSLNFPGSIESVGAAAYAGCTGISTIEIGELGNPGTPLSFGEFAFSGCSNVTQLNINKNIVDDPLHSPFMDLSSLRNVVVSNQVSKLNTFAFYGCTKLETISIPNSVNYIGSAAFQGCISLTNVKLPKNLSFISNQLFHSCTNLISVNIPNGVKSIGSYAFYNCEKISRIILPTGVELVGPVAFYGCKALVELFSANYLPPATGASCFTGIQFANASLTVPIGSKSKYKNDSQWSVFTTIIEDEIGTDTTHTSDTTTVFPESFMGIEKRIEISAGGLFSALSPQELASINELTLSGHINASDFLVMRDQMPQLNVIDLTNVVVDSYTGWNGTAGNGSYPANTIPVSAFENKNNLYSIKLPNSIISIADKAFKQCVNIQQELVLPAGLTRIGNESFSSCQSLYGLVEIPLNVTYIGERAFERCKKILQVKMLAKLNAIEYSTFAGCEYLMKIDMPETVTSLKGSAFYECGRLFVVNIPGLRSISDNVFAKCGFRSFNLPSTLVALGDYAFAGCYSLKEIVIPPLIGRLGSGIFYDCLTLATIHLPANLSYIGDGVFANCSRITSIYLNAVKPPEFLYPGSAFTNLVYSRCVLYVPKGTLDAYFQALDWQMFSKIVEMSVTDLKQETVSDIRIFPNPVAESLIVSGLTDIVELTLFDLSGACVITIQVENNQKVSLHKLAQGTYIARLRTKSNIIKTKIVKL